MIFSTPPFNEYGNIRGWGSSNYDIGACFCQLGGLSCNTTTVQQKAEQAYANYDEIIVLHNQDVSYLCWSNADRTCGGGNRNHFSRVWARDPWGYEYVARHEFGHSFGGLDEEYNAGQEPPGGVCVYPNGIVVQTL